MFVGFDDEDGAARYNTKDEAIERAKQMIKWGGEPGDRIMVHRQWVPLWLAHLVQQTPFEWVAYTELK